MKAKARDCETKVCCCVYSISANTRSQQFFTKKKKMLTYIHKTIVLLSRINNFALEEMLHLL